MCCGSQLNDVKKRAKDSKEIVTAANDLDKKMTAIEEALYQTKNKSPEDPLNYPVRLNNKLAAVGDSAAIGAWGPTAQDIAVRDEVTKQIDEQLVKLKANRHFLPSFDLDFELNSIIGIVPGDAASPGKDLVKQ